MGKPVVLSERCCGEAGTLGTSRPDIANQLRFRKSEELLKGIKTLSIKNPAEAPGIKLLTSCPACVQGLSRYTDETALKPDYIVVETIRQLHGEQWQQRFIDQMLKDGVELVLV
jgi:Fe-S oxidoreductase